MRKYTIQARNVQNVAASSTVLIDLPVGPRYHKVTLEHAFTDASPTIAEAMANITEIRVKANGRVQRVHSGTQLRDLNVLNGPAYDCQGSSGTAPGVSFPIFFAEPWRDDPRDQDALAWPTAGFQSFQIEAALGAAAAPTMVASCVVDNFAPSGDAKLGFSKILRLALPASGSQFDISTIDRRDYLTQISIYPDTTPAAPTLVTIRRDGEIIHELTRSANFAHLMNNLMHPRLAAYTNDSAIAAPARTAGIYDIVFDHDGLLSSAVAMDGVRDFTLTVNHAGWAGGTCTMLIQRIGPLE